MSSCKKGYFINVSYCYESDNVCVCVRTHTSCTVLIYSRSTHPPGNCELFELLQTELYIKCAFHLPALSWTVNILSLSLLQHSGIHFQKKLDSLSHSLSLNQHSELTFCNMIMTGVCVNVLMFLERTLWVPG